MERQDQFRPVDPEEDKKQRIKSVLYKLRGEGAPQKMVGQEGLGGEELAGIPQLEDIPEEEGLAPLDISPIPKAKFKLKV